jgi:hypothetical protein
LSARQTTPSPLPLSKRGLKTGLAPRREYDVKDGLRHH